MENYTYLITSFNKTQLPNHPFICSIGHEKRYQSDAIKYEWDSKKSIESLCIFQYTVAGEGVLEINNKKYKQTPGTAFLIERPGPYKYWIPEHSDFWELEFVSLSISSIPFWNAITKSFGRIIKMDRNNELMNYFDEVYSKAKLNQIDNCFENSLIAYTFIMKLHQYLKQHGTAMDGAEAVQMCVEFINTNYDRNISNVEIAAAGYISPFYINKRFKDVIGETPVQYLTKVRLRNSIMLLNNTNLSIEAISKQCGFDNSNYFAKVFRKNTNYSPSDFRKTGHPPIYI